MSLFLRFGEDRERWRWDGVAELAFRPFASFSHGDGLGHDDESSQRAVSRLRDDGLASPVAAMSPTNAFEIESATTHRLVIDLAGPDRTLSVLSPGQSEHPHHPHFDDGVGAPLAAGWRQPEIMHLASDEAARSAERPVPPEPVKAQSSDGTPVRHSRPGNSGPGPASPVRLVLEGSPASVGPPP